MPLRAQPPQGCASANFATSANPGRHRDYFFFGAAGAGTAGAEVFVGCRCSAVPPALEPLFFVAMIDKEIEVSMKITVEIVVTRESSVTEPRGPKAV